MFVIVFGDPIDGINITGNEEGMPFESYEEALKYAEPTDSCAWWIVEISKWE